MAEEAVGGVNAVRHGSGRVLREPRGLVAVNVVVCVGAREVVVVVVVVLVMVAILIGVSVGGGGGRRVVFDALEVLDGLFRGFNYFDDYAREND